MPTFYYLAVSGDHRRLNGKIEALNDAAARSELNKMGLSVLSISDQPPVGATTNTKKTFEFEAVDRFKKLVNGTIDTQDALSAYERLTTEFKFEVHYLCAENATPAEKQVARDGGIKRLQAAESAKKALEAERSKPIMKMSLGQIVERAEAKLKKVDAPVVSAAPLGISPDTESLDYISKDLTDEQTMLDQERERAAAALLVQQKNQPKKKMFMLDVLPSQELASVVPATEESLEKGFSAEDFDFQQNQQIAPVQEVVRTTKLTLDDKPLTLREASQSDLMADAAESETASKVVDLTAPSIPHGEELALKSPLFWKGDVEGRASRKVEKVIAEKQPTDVDAEQVLASTAANSVVRSDLVTRTQRSLVDQLNFSLDFTSLASGMRNISTTLVTGSVLPIRTAVGEVLTGVLLTFLSVFVLLTLFARYHLAGFSTFEVGS